MRSVASVGLCSASVVGLCSALSVVTPTGRRGGRNGRRPGPARGRAEPGGAVLLGVREDVLHVALRLGVGRHAAAEPLHRARPGVVGRKREALVAAESVELLA